MPGSRYNTIMTRTPDVLILGGGVIGLSTAYFLAREGASVTLIDKDDLGRAASWAGAGILPPGDPDRAQTPLERLRAHSVRMYPGLSKDLQQRTGIDNGYRVSGGLDLIGADDGAPADEWRSQGIVCREVSGDELRRLEPGLAPRWERALHLPDMAQVRNPRHLQALIAACEWWGVRLLPECGARSMIRVGRRVTAFDTDRGRFEARRFVIAAGAWSEDLLGLFGWRPGIRPVRGQIVLLNTGTEEAHPLLLCGKRYVVPRGDGRVLVGSTEEDAGFDTRTTAEAVADLIAFATSLLPALGRASVERCWAGLRPGSPDGLPLIGPVPGCDNVFVNAGHFRSGLQLAPASGLVMAQLLLDRKPLVPVDAFRLDR
jgi:glycine oxidase